MAIAAQCICRRRSCGISCSGTMACCRQWLRSRRHRIVLADGELLAPEGLDRERGIQFIIPDELRAVIPQRRGLHAGASEGGDGVPVRQVAGRRRHRLHRQCTIIAAALTLIERSLLPDRPCFFVTAGRRGGGKTTTTHNADHGGHGFAAGSGGLVDK